MGGFGSGGARVGSGRKKKSDAAKVFHGTATRRERKRRSRGVSPSAQPAVAMPDDLSVDERKIWRKLAPHALAAGTLTQATALAFRHLCEAIVLKRLMLAEIKEYGCSSIDVDAKLTANPLLTQYRSMLQRVETGMMKFMLAPLGKSTLPEEKPEDPFAAFDDDDDDGGNRNTH